MCRLTIYKGRPILIGDLIIAPENSLLYQSRDAAYHPGVIDKTNQRNILVNGDGFGVSWYGNDVTAGSCCFKFVTPAWSDTNLRNIGRHVSSPLVFAHVRAAAHNPFEPVIVSNENCHPFTYKEYTFVHNGGIPSFQLIKLSILKLLTPQTFANIKGTTDTEHIFAIYLNCLPDRKPGELHTVTEMVEAMNQTVSVILQLCTEHGITDHCSLNLCVTNGVHIIATRFRTGPRAPPSLYYNIGSNFVCRNGHFYAEDDTTAAEIVISSAPLSKVCCPQDHPVECELDASYAEGVSGANTPAARASMPAGSPSGNRPGLRPSASAASRRAALNPAYNGNATAPVSPQPPCPSQAALCSESEQDGLDSDIGSWILIPKNHMLVCQGDVNNPHSLASFYLEPVTVTKSTKPLSCPLWACRDAINSVATDSISATLSGILEGGCITLGKRDATEAEVEVCSESGEEDSSGHTTVLSTSTSASRLDGPLLNLARQVSDGSPACKPSRPCSGVVFSPNCTKRPKVIKFSCQM
jgi:glutamine amidotransferase